MGLLTGDNSINGEAPIVVMTTEVLRNMLYERSDTLTGLQTVVMDEVHYLQDPYRGAVWEEVLIHLPPSVAVVCLSATISNAEEFGEWIATLRGDTDVVIEEQRPVPLEHHYLVGDRLHPMHVESTGHWCRTPTSSPSTARRSGTDPRAAATGVGARAGRAFVPRREDVVEVLEDAGMLPAIYFVFSRAGLRAERPVARGVRGPPHDARGGPPDPRPGGGARGLDRRRRSRRPRLLEFLEAAAAGVAAHHAGMLPVFKETVEELFEAGLIKVVFATETLSLGINMPAKTVVIEDLWKFQGERHELLTPGEYTQLTGRAGRRGIDALGHAVVVYQRQVPFERVAGLAATRTYDLTSSFRPSYNMAVNLVRNYTPEQAHQLLNCSFAQFLADRGVVALERARKRDREALESYREHLVCDRGDFDEYWALRREARQLRAGDRKGRTARSRRRAPGPRRAHTGRRDRGAEAPRRRIARGRARGARGPADRADRRPLLLPARGARLHGAARRAHADRPAALGFDAGAPATVATSPRQLTALHVRPPRRGRVRRPTPRSSGARPRWTPRRARTRVTGARTGARTSGGPSGRTSSRGRSRASTGGSPSAPRRWPGGSIACSGCSASSTTSTGGSSPTRGGG